MNQVMQSYGNSLAGGLNPRDVEAAAFVFVNRALESAEDDRARITALGRNQKLWSLLLKDLALSSNALPPALKDDLVRLGSWAMRYSLNAIGEGLPVQPLLDVNRDMIEGLRAANDQAAPGAVATSLQVAI